MLRKDEHTVMIKSTKKAPLQERTGGPKSGKSAARGRTPKPGPHDEIIESFYGKNFEIKEAKEELGPHDSTITAGDTKLVPSLTNSFMLTQQGHRQKEIQQIFLNLKLHKKSTENDSAIESARRELQTLDKSSKNTSREILSSDVKAGVNTQSQTMSYEQKPEQTEKVYDIHCHSTINSIKDKIIKADRYISTLKDQTSSKLGRRIQNEDFGTQIILQHNQTLIDRYDKRKRTAADLKEERKAYQLQLQEMGQSQPTDHKAMINIMTPESLDKNLSSMDFRDYLNQSHHTQESLQPKTRNIPVQRDRVLAQTVSNLHRYSPFMQTLGQPSTSTFGLEDHSKEIPSFLTAPGSKDTRANSVTSAQVQQVEKAVPP